VIVDAQDFPELSKYVWWADHSYGSYRVIRLVNKDRGHTALQIHRQIMEKENTNFEKEVYTRLRGNDNKELKLVVDHINRNSLDNRRANLRLATHLENARNRIKINKKCSSKYKGVCWSKHHKKWQAAINFKRKSIHLGYFDNETEAAECYDDAARKYHGEFACLNFPPPNKRGLKNLLKYYFNLRT
jgi:hypothetical protein